MDSVKIYIDGIQKDVYGVFYIYNSKYYFIYTEKEVDENGYVILYMVQVGKETKSTPNGPVDTGYMVGVEVADAEEQKKAQVSVSYIVEDKKNGTTNPEIQYLPISMIVNLKISSKKRFRLLKSIMMDNFDLTFEESSTDIVENILSEPMVPEVAPVVEPTAPVVPEVAPIVEPIAPVVPEVAPIVEPTAPVVPEVAPVVEPTAPVMSEVTSATTETNINDTNVIIDYRSKYFEEEEKNQQLQAKIDELTQKLNEIKKVIE